MSAPAVLKITSPPELIEAATRVIVREVPNFHRYDKVGWGWSFNDRLAPGAKFFVRRIKGGLSVVATPTPNDKA